MNKVQVFRSEKTTIVDLSSKQSLLIQPNLIPLDSVRILAAECWGNYNSLTLPRLSLPSTLTIKELDPSSIPADKTLFFERVRRTLVAKSIMRALKALAVNTIMLKKQYFRWTDLSGDTHDDGPTLLKLIFLEVNPATKIYLQ